MAAHLARFVAIFLVVRGSVATGSSEDTLQRVKRDDDSDESSSSSSSSSSSASQCPCTRGCCDEGWFQYRDACYKPVQQKQMWRQAEEYCVSLASHLASVHSHEEDNFIVHVMGNVKLKSYWLGAEKTKQGEAEHWTWTDQSLVQYSPSRVVTASNERQIHLTASKADDKGTIVWRHQEGSKTHPFICKHFLT